MTSTETLVQLPEQGDETNTEEASNGDAKPAEGEEMNGSEQELEKKSVDDEVEKDSPMKEMKSNGKMGKKVESPMKKVETSMKNDSPVKKRESPTKKGDALAATKESVTPTKTEESPTKKGEKKASSEKKASPVKKASPEKKTEAVKSGRETRKRKADDVEKKPAKEEHHEDGDEPTRKALFESPIVLEGKRERHTVERLASTIKASPAVKKSAEGEGTGIALGEIEYVSTMINKHSADMLKPLHRILYNRPGTATFVKKNVRHFNGFPFDSRSPDFEKKTAQLAKLSMSELKVIRSVLGVESAAQKNDLVKHIMAFLMKPFDAGRRPPGAAKKAKKAKSTSSPANTKKKDKTVKKTAKGSAKKGGQKAEQSDADSDSGDESSNSGDSEHKPEQPVAKKSRSSPSESELESSIRSLLNGVDLEAITMKQMCATVFEKFPDSHLEDRKGEIKSLIKKIIAETAD